MAVRTRVGVDQDIVLCGMCGDATPVEYGKRTADFGLVCSVCADRYRKAQRDATNMRDESGVARAQIGLKAQEAVRLLKECCVAADQIDANALQGELMVVIAGLENVIWQPRRRNSARQFPADDKNG